MVFLLNYNLSITTKLNQPLLLYKSKLSTLHFNQINQTKSTKMAPKPAPPPWTPTLTKAAPSPKWLPQGPPSPTTPGSSAPSRPCRARTESRESPVRQRRHRPSHGCWSISQFHNFELSSPLLCIRLAVIFPDSELWTKFWRIWSSHGHKNARLALSVMPISNATARRSIKPFLSGKRHQPRRTKVNDSVSTVNRGAQKHRPDRMFW